MKFKSLFIIFALLLNGCTNTNNLDIAGAWESSCFEVPDFFQFANSNNPPSGPTFTNMTSTYSDGTITHKYNSYSDSDCQSLKETDFSNLYASSTISVLYSIGNTITTSNGAEAYEIDFIYDNGIIVEDIFSVINNGETLVFGNRNFDEFFSCYPQTGPDLPFDQTGSIGGNTAECTRPTELNYDSFLSRVN